MIKQNLSRIILLIFMRVLKMYSANSNYQGKPHTHSLSSHYITAAPPRYTSPPCLALQWSDSGHSHPTTQRSTHTRRQRSKVILIRTGGNLLVTLSISLNRLHFLSLFAPTTARQKRQRWSQKRPEQLVVTYPTCLPTRHIALFVRSAEFVMMEAKLFYN